VDRRSRFGLADVGRRADADSPACLLDASAAYTTGEYETAIAWETRAYAENPAATP
jgi:hypothetical protein